MLKNQPCVRWATALVASVAIAIHAPAHAEPCMKITLTGTQGGPLVFKGQAGPDRDSGFPAPIYYRQSTATDLGAMAERVGASHLMLTHLIPPLNASKQGPYPIPDGALTEASYADAVALGGYSGTTIVGTDLVSITLPSQ